MVDEVQTAPETSLWSQLLSLPVRFLAAFLTVLAAAQWHDSPIGVQLGWALQFGLLLAVSILASFWRPFFIINSVIALLWLGTLWPPKEMPPGRKTTNDWRDVVTWANRQVEHIELLATSIAVALVWTHSLLWQLTALAVVAFLGTPILNGLTRVWRWIIRESGDGRPATLLKDRHIVIYGLTLLGLLALVGRAWDQMRVALPLVLAVLAGLSLRAARSVIRIVQEKRSSEFRGYRHQLAERQYRLARLTGWMGPAAVVLAFAIVVVVSMWERRQLRAAANDENDGPPPPVDRCLAEAGGPSQADIALFLIADTHVHELDGYRFPGQMEVADAIMPVSRRPVELDLLSSAPIVHFERVLKDLGKQRRTSTTALQPPAWAHLGDFADLDCRSEMMRALALVKRYSSGGSLLAGFAPGSHDMAFQGNFDWSPYWAPACRASPMDKATMDPMIEALLADTDVSKAETEVVRGFEWARLQWDRPLARWAVARLGTLSANKSTQERRGVLGVFIDTTDRAHSNRGIAGAYGSFSKKQADAIRERVGKIREKSEDPAWADPWLVLLGHSPFADLTGRSQKELASLIADLDKGPADCQHAECREPRVLGMLAAHVHTASAHRHCLANRMIREIVIGSTLDPPQEAALLEIGLDEGGHAALRVSTLPTVARAGYTCSDTGAVAARTCRSVVARLARQRECRDLLQGWAARGFEASTCEELERPVSLAEKLSGIALHGGPNDPEAIDDAQEKHGRVLLQCLCRSSDTRPQSCDQALRNPLDDSATSPAVEALARDPSRADEVTCLAWAASVLQSHKARGMSMADALRCSFDDPTLQPARVITTSAEEKPCY